MKIKVIASTKVGYVLPKEEAIDFSGKSAGICYLPDTVETLFAEAPEKLKEEQMETWSQDIIAFSDMHTIILFLKVFQKFLQ